jgi:phasin family protein
MQHLLLTHPKEFEMLTVDQVMAAHKANVETLFGLTNTAFEGVEKLVELNLSASRATLSDVASQATSALSIKDAQELLTLQSNLFQPLAEKTAAYSRHLYDIANGTSAEFSKVVEAQASEAQKKILSLVESTSLNAPAGTDTAVTAMKTAVAAASNAMESVQKSVKQATELMESNFKAVTSNAVNAAKPAAKKR